MVKVIFYIKAQKANKNVKAPIFARISFKTSETSISTGKSIELQRWEQTKKLRSLLKLLMFHLKIVVKFKNILHK